MSSRLYEMLLQAAAYADKLGSMPRKYNPRPAGHVVPGSGTDLALKYLRSVTPAWASLKEIREQTHLGYGCLGWALLRLQADGQVEAVKYGGHGINTRYLRYRVTGRGAGQAPEPAIPVDVALWDADTCAQSDRNQEL